MAHREHEQGYRGGQYDRDYENERFERGGRDDRWERTRDAAEFSGSDEHMRRQREREYRDYRGTPEEYGEDWQGGRYGPGMRGERSYERRGLFGGAIASRSYGGPESLEWTREEREYRGARGGSIGRGAHGGRWEREESERADFAPRRRADYGNRGGEDYGGYGAPWQSVGYEQSGFAFPRRYGEYGGYGAGVSRGQTDYESGATGYGPSTGYGYGPTEDYIGSESGMRRSDLRQRNFAGRGPRNYRRSDDRIKEDVNERLTRHPDIDASDIDVRVENCTVILSGVVEDRKAKRLAEDIAEDVWGTEDVKNELKVRHGFLAALTGEQADERDVTRPAVRDAEATRRTASGRAAGSTGSVTGTTTE